MPIGDGLVGFVSIPGSGAVTIQPPSGEEWVLRDLVADGIPQAVELGLYDGVNYAPLRYENSNVWLRPLRMFMTNATYARIVNTLGSSTVIGYNAVITAVAGTVAGRADAKTAVISLAGSATATIQPPSGETWSVSDVGSTQTFTFSSSAYANVKAQMTDGVNTRAFYPASGDTYIHPWSGFVTHSCYLLLANMSGSAAVVCYSAVRMS